MARLAAHVTRLGAIWAVARDVPRLAAVVARLAASRLTFLPTLGAVARNVPRLVAVVARRLVRALCALAGYMSRAVTPVASLLLFLAISSEVSRAVAFEALLASAVVVPAVAPITGTTATAALVALPGKVPCAITLVANARIHGLQNVLIIINTFVDSYNKTIYIRFIH